MRADARIDVDRAVDTAAIFVAEGAHVLDVGGESTRPGAHAVPAGVEIDRTASVIEALAKRFDVPISIDTRKASVAKVALEAGACIVNDVSGLRHDAGLAGVAARGKAGLILGHLRGEPETMQQDPHFDDVLSEVSGFLAGRAAACMQQGIPRERILLDPGFGFGKTTTHNLQLLQQLEQLVATGFPVLVGLSRKSLIGKVLDLPVDKRLYPGLALAVLAVWKGAAIVRCHDVRETREAIEMCQAVRDVQCQIPVQDLTKQA